MVGSEDRQDEPPGVRRQLPLVRRLPSTQRAGGLRDVRIERRKAAQDRAAAVRERRAAARDLDRAAAYLILADVDELTGALQRFQGMVELRRAVNHAHLTRTPLVVAFVDVDRLKVVNDIEGHAAGDTLLRGVGFAMRKAVRAGDLVLRYGGDEFVCVLINVELEAATARLEEVRRQLGHLVADASISIGLAQLRPAETSEMIVGRADREMYQSRRPSRRRSD